MVFFGHIGLDVKLYLIGGVLDDRRLTGQGSLSGLFDPQSKSR